MLLPMYSIIDQLHRVVTQGSNFSQFTLHSLIYSIYIYKVSYSKLHRAPCNQTVARLPSLLLIKFKQISCLSETLVQFSEASLDPDPKAKI